MPYFMPFLVTDRTRVCGRWRAGVRRCSRTLTPDRSPLRS